MKYKLLIYISYVYPTKSLIAQMVEHWPYVPLVMGSIPIERIFIYILNTYVNKI